MQGIDQHHLVIFAGSFNKVLFPSLRMGYLVLPPTLVEVFERTKSIIGRHHSLFDQVKVREFIDKGHFGRHLRRMREIYSQRRETLTHHADKHLSGLLALSDIEAGLQTVGWLRNGFRAENVCSAAARRNIDVVPLDRYCRKSILPQAIQIGFAAVDERAIEEDVQLLAGVMNYLDSGKRLFKH